MHNNKFHIPTIFVILGATGDLMHKKIVPALFHLYKGGYLPKMFHVIGFSRRHWDDRQFRDSLVEILEEHKEEDFDQFVRTWSYHEGSFENLDQYSDLAHKLGLYDDKWHVCSNKLFYIAAPPQYYSTILTNLHQSKLTEPCSPEEGFTRVLIEKPFGKDQKTAEDLEKLLSRLFKEEQIYRIDHYLAKEMLQNILNFRFSNAIFESSWSNQYIEKVRIRLWETLGVEKRGVFYDGIGALRDVGQNHLLQMLALVTMDHPGSFSTEAIRSRRLEILKTLMLPKEEEIKKYTYRAQYDDYQKISGVKPKSKTETYFKIRAYLNSPRWKGVPFILESGKRLPIAQKEIIITFKHPNPCLCPSGSNHDLKNRLIFQLEPNEGVFLDLWSKKPGLLFDVKGQKFQFLIREQQKRTQYVEEYEKLLLDSIRGDQTLFVRSDEVSTMWKFIDPISYAWEENAVPLKSYKPDSEEPMLESQFIDTSIDNGRSIRKMRQEIGIIGLGKMGANIARHLKEKGWSVYGYNRTQSVADDLLSEGILPAHSIAELVQKLHAPKLLWLSLPAGTVLDGLLFGKDGLYAMLNKGDVIVDGGNSFYKNTITRAKKMAVKGIKYIDAGVSGGPAGARYGASLMIGGDVETFKHHERLFFDLAVAEGYQHFEGTGAGHFVKMIHNGIEYGIMQAIAEGFTLLKRSEFHLGLSGVAQVYNHGSVIESKLMEWLQNALTLHGESMEKVSGTVAHTGEGLWTIQTAEEMKIQTKVIQDALQFRIDSEKNPSYTGKILSALREQFGGHSIK